MTRALKRSARAVVLAGVLLLAVGGPASAAPPCWKSLLNDWYDGTIHETYPIACYQQAVDHLPTDAQLYSSAKEDILRAMGQAIALEKQTTTTAATTTTATSSLPAETTTTATTTATETVLPTTTTTSSGRKKEKGLAGAIDKLNPGEADSFPLPLLILGALAIFLVAAGIVGMIWRRMDRDGTGPSTP